MENPYAAPQSEVYTTTGPQAAPLTWKQILFSFDGRIPRRTYWAFSILIGLIQLTAAYALSSLFGTDFQLAITIAAWTLTIWPTVAIGAKRWHDRNKSGLCILVILIPSFVGIFTPAGGGQNTIGIISGVAGLWVFIQCGCLRGTAGTNNYGSDPT